MKTSHLLAALGTLVFAQAAFAQLDSNKVIAKVDGIEIKAAEYYSRMEFLPNVGRLLEGNTFEKSPPGLLTLQLLIEEKVLLQCAKENSAYPSDAEVKAEMARKEERDPTMYKAAIASGVPAEFLQQQTLIEVAQFKLITKGINITDAQIDAHYKSNQREFTVPKKVKIRLIAASDKAKDDVDKLLSSGKAFSDVAKELSEDISKLDGGLLGEVPIDEFNPDVKSALEGIKIGQTTEWIKGNRYFVKFLKESVIPAKLQPLDDKLKRDIRRNLMIDRGMVKNDLEAMLKATRKKMKVELMVPQFGDQFKAFLDRSGFGK